MIHTVIQLFKKAQLIPMIGILIAAILVITQPAAVDAAKHRAALKSSASSVVRTSNLEKTRLAAKKYGLRETKITPLPQGQAIVTLDASVSSTGAQMLQQDMRDDPHFKLLPNYTYRPAAEPNDPLYTNKSQWNLAKINAPKAWDITTGSPGKTIAVIDSGVLFSQSWKNSPDCPPGSPCTQPDMPTERSWINKGETGATTSEGATPNCTSAGLTLDKSCNNIDDDTNGYIDDQKGWDFVGGWRGQGNTCPNSISPTTYENPDYVGYIDYDNDPQPYSCDSPTHPGELNRNHYDGTCVTFESACYTSHGTSVASIAAASANNSKLIAGIDWHTKVMSVRALDGYGWGDSALITAAVEYATAMKVSVINLSLALFTGGDCTVTDTLLEDALASAKAAGIVIVAAAGNGGSEGVCYPARSANAIGVGASDSNDSRASFSNYGSELEVVAPGVNVPVALAPTKSSDYAKHSLTANGTSFSSPHVAGVATLLLATKPTLTPDEVRSTITQRADKVTGMNGQQQTKEYGYGRVNAYKTVAPKVLSYVPLSAPRNMWLTADTQKTNLLTLKKTGETFSKGRIVRFETKVLLNGVWYLRSQYDTQNNNDLGIPLTMLAELPTYTLISPPRDMRLTAKTQKTNLLTLVKTGETFRKGQIMRFETKTYINGTWYLRSKYDTGLDNHLGIPLTVLKD